MPFVVQAVRPDPPLDIVVSEPTDGRRRRMTVLSGVVAVAPVPTGRLEVRVAGRQPDAEPIGFYVPGAEPVPSATDVTALVEASLTQAVVTGHTTHDTVYGIGDLSVRLVVDERNAAVRWPFITFVCYGQRPLGVRYRVTLLRAHD
jgi:hypothetical protein